MLINHEMGKDKYKEMINSGFINPLSSYPEIVEVFFQWLPPNVHPTCPSPILYLPS